MNMFNVTDRLGGVRDLIARRLATDTTMTVAARERRSDGQPLKHVRASAARSREAVAPSNLTARA